MKEDCFWKTLKDSRIPSFLAPPPLNKSKEYFSEILLTHDRRLVLEDLEGLKDLLLVTFVSVGQSVVHVSGRLLAIPLDEDSMSETCGRYLDALLGFPPLGFGGDVDDA